VSCRVASTRMFIYTCNIYTHVFIYTHIYRCYYILYIYIYMYIKFSRETYACAVFPSAPVAPASENVHLHNVPECPSVTGKRKRTRLRVFLSIESRRKALTLRGNERGLLLYIYVYMCKCPSYLVDVWHKPGPHHVEGSTIQILVYTS
jgi:hypothetical protein